MSTTGMQVTIEAVERLVAAADLELAIEKLLNLVETLNAENQALGAEVDRLRQQLEQKKKAKTTDNQDSDGQDSSSNQASKSDHSSEKHRKNDRPKPEGDRRSFKDLKIHDTVECSVDPATLPPDAVRVADEIVIVQDIEIQPKNTQFQRQVFYSASQQKFYRAPLPPGYDQGDFGATLRALIVALKYCGNMSEPKIGEFLENFDVQVSSGSISNILTHSAAHFEPDYHDVLVAGLSSTKYQQTDDTSARVQGAFWHTHILCNPFYTLYSTRPHKDRLAVLEVLQNTDDLHFRLGVQTLELLETEFSLPAKWQQKITELGEVELASAELKSLLDGWFGEGNKQLRTAIEQAAAMVYYWNQDWVPIVEILVCDDAGQFKLLTAMLALCWIHDGRHYEKLAPVVGCHKKALQTFQEDYWNYYRSLQDYRAGPSDQLAAKLRLEFDKLFSRRTGFAMLDERIARTESKRDQLLTVLTEPSVPLHNNASELGARVSARRRDVSLHSRSVRGARAMDVFTTLVQTSKKLGLSAFEYFRDRFSGAQNTPSLAQSIQKAAQSAAASG